MLANGIFQKSSVGLLEILRHIAKENKYRIISL
jgi:hypothetical protein